MGRFRVFVILPLLVLGAQCRAESPHSLLFPLLGSSVGMIDGRVAKESEAPEVLHLLAVTGDRTDVRNVKFKCSSTAIGRCIISAAHCFDKLEATILARGVGGFETKLLLDKIRVFKKLHEKTDGTDLAIARLDAAPTKYLDPEDLAKPEDVTYPELPARLTKDDVKTYGIGVEVAGYGMRYDKDDVLKEMASRPYEESGAAKMGDIFKQHRDAVKPPRQVGDMRVLGSLATLLGKKDDERYASLVTLPSPARPLGGDSGGPLFYKAKRGRVLLGVFTAGVDDVETAKKMYSATLWKDAASLRAGIATSVAERRAWLLEQYDKLGCALPKPKDAMK